MIVEKERHTYEAALAAIYGGYRVQNGVVSWGDKPLRLADAATWTTYYFWWAGDGRRVFAWGKWVKSADPATFAALNFAVARDANNVYDREGRAYPSLHPATLCVFDGGIVRDAHSNITDEGGYGTDGTTVFYADDRVSALDPPADPAAFALLGGGYGGDGKTVYYGCRRIPGANPGTFRALSRRFARDARHIYFGAKRITGADPDTFAVTGDYVDTARDKNGRFDLRTVSMARTP